ncbi:MAG: hypothetical protein ABJD07_08815 [Gemmatimonadaceae bacterium]
MLRDRPARKGGAGEGNAGRDEFSHLPAVPIGGRGTAADEVCMPLVDHRREINVVEARDQGVKRRVGAVGIVAPIK